jgi:23S rRNA U2552 (ribose-2'-O)-methylase RlmE/FtsJ
VPGASICADAGAHAASGTLNGTIIALDILPMDPIEGVTFIQGDFREPAVLAQLEQAVGGRKADVVVSDMAPNLSGIDSADAARVEPFDRAGHGFFSSPHEARGRPGGQSVPWQWLQPAGATCSRRSSK